MQSVIPAIRALLVADGAVLALVKSGTGIPRVYLMRAEQFTGGADVVMSEVFGDMNMALSGSTTPWTSRISLECRASTYAASEALGRACKAVLIPFKGTSLDQDIQSSFHAGEYGDYNDEGTVFRSIVDFRIVHQPA